MNLPSHLRARLEESWRERIALRCTKEEAGRLQDELLNRLTRATDCRLTVVYLSRSTGGAQMKAPAVVAVAAAFSQAGSVLVALRDPAGQAAREVRIGHHVGASGWDHLDVIH